MNNNYSDTSHVSHSDIDEGRRQKSRLSPDVASVILS